MHGQTTENQLFVAWVNFLKKDHGIANSAVADCLSISSQKVANIKRGNSSVSEMDLRKMVLCFPQLRTKAFSAGINPYPTAEEFQQMPEQLQQEHQTAMERENELLQELLNLERERNARNEERIDQLLKMLELQRKQWIK